MALRMREASKGRPSSAASSLAASGANVDRPGFGIVAGGAVARRLATRFANALGAITTQRGTDLRSTCHDYM